MSASRNTVLRTRTRIAWMGRHSGYDRLCDVLVEHSPGWRFVDVSRNSGPLNPLWRRYLDRKRRGCSASPLYDVNSYLLERAVVRTTRKERPDLVHLMYLEKDFGLLADRSRSEGAGLIATVHQPPSWWKLAHGRPGVVRPLDALIVLTDRDAGFWEEILPGRVFVARHGVDVDFFCPAESTSPQPSHPRCLIVGHWLRDLRTLADVVDLLVRRNPTIGFDVVIPLVARSQDGLLRLARHDSVIFHADLGDEALRDLYRRSTLLLLPMLDATANNAILEAQACGSPIVSTNAGGVASYVDSSFADLLPVGDVAGIADAVMRLVEDDDELTRRGRAARAHAVENLSWQRVVQDTMNGRLGERGSGCAGRCGRADHAMADHGSSRMDDDRRPDRSRESIDASAAGSEEHNLFGSSVFVRRLIRLSARCEIVADTLPEDGVEFRFLRWKPDGGSPAASFSFAAQSSGVVSDSRMGILLTDGTDGEVPVLWLPRSVVVGRIDDHGRLTMVNDETVESWWEVDELPRLHLRMEPVADATVFLPMIAFDGSAALRPTDLFELGEVELQRFRKSDWFDASSPADLWRYLIDAAVFDPRDAGQGRFQCQQCACAWWSYLMVLNRATGKAFYRVLARWLAWSARVALAADGSWRHGFWNAEPEIHARMLWDGVRLLLSEHEIAPHAELLGAAEAATRFAIENLSEELADGHLWFLHDSDEGAEPLRIAEPVLGRSSANSLCLNTHVQALCVLAQMRRITGGDRFRDEYQRGMGALDAVLRLACERGPMVWVDRVLPSLLSLKIPHGVMERTLRFIAYRIVASGYWWARRRARCLVFPSGYIDRDLGRTMLADEYHVVNLKDLSELHRLDPRPWLGDVISRGIRFAATLDFERALQRSPIWAEWIDVLEVTDLAVDLDTDSLYATVAGALGGTPLDAHCAVSGVWRFEGADG